MAGIFLAGSGQALDKLLKTELDDQGGAHIGGVWDELKAALEDALERRGGSDEQDRKAGSPIQTGAIGNPYGRPKGAKARFSIQFIAAVQEAWQNGEAALRILFREQPDKFVSGVCVTIRLYQPATAQRHLACIGRNGRRRIGGRLAVRDVRNRGEGYQPRRTRT